MATTTAGEDVDMDGYTVLVDGASGQAIGANGILTIPGLAAGDREVELTDVASNCTVAGQNPRMVAVTGGATVRTDFEVTCAGIIPPHPWSARSPSRPTAMATRRSS